MTTASVKLSCSREEWTMLLKLRPFNLREITLQMFVHISARNEYHLYSKGLPFYTIR